MCDSVHTFCYECINLYFESKLTEDDFNISCICPQVGCGKELYPEILDECLSADLGFIVAKANALKKLKYPENLFPLDCPLCPKNSQAFVLIDPLDFPSTHKCF